LSSKKDKLLESVQKFIAKGQFDRAIKDYERIIALDPGDTRQRQRLAELLIRDNRKEEAVAEYEAIGKHYSDNAFYQKSIAVYKQVQKLDPANIKFTLALATLYEKQGLIGNALAEYNQAVNYYQKADSLPEALKVLEKMLAADPENLNTHLKFAETYFAAGLADKAYREFMQLALRLQTRGDESAFSRVCEKVLGMYPDKKDFLLDLLTTQIEEGEAAAAIPRLEEILARDNSNLQAWKLLVDAYLQTGDNESRKTTLQNIVKLFPDESSAVESLVQIGLDEGESLRQTAELPAEESRAGAGRGYPETPLPGEPKETVRDMPSEEEIDLALPEETGTNEPKVAEEGAEQTDIFREAGSSLESAGLTEVDLVIENTDITHDEWFQDSDKVEPVAVGGMENPSHGEKQGNYDRGGQFTDHNKGTDSQIDKRDTESHYDLGIAYKEMGLYDNAIAEFKAAASDPRRKIDCLTLEGICYRDKGDIDRAEEVFISARLQSGLSGEELLSLNYELALLYETGGWQEKALHLYRQVRAADPAFRDVAQKILLLQGGDVAPEHDELELLELEVEDSG
jgi:tetratricopeptide (TPR) repeat protein